MSAHDVRNLGTCILCQKIGTFDPRMASIALLLILQRPGRGKSRIGAHPRCLVREETGGGHRTKYVDIRFITILGVEEMGKIRRDDLPEEAYRRVIVAHAAQMQQLEGKA